MAANPYDQAPLQVTLYDVPGGTAVRSYMFLGNVPQNVLAAAAQPDSPAPLERYYGKQWKRILEPDTALATVADERGPDEVAGGDASEFGNLDDFDDLDIVIEEGDLDDSPSSIDDISGKRAAVQVDQADWDSRTVYLGLAAYPEDTLADVKAKIFAATGIPPYRQHIFYSNEDSPGAPARTSYRVTVEGGLVLTDVRNLTRDLRREGDMVAGIPIDRRLEERKDDLRVDALDTFRTLEESPGTYIRRVFVADMASLFRGREGALRKAMSDRYQFDLLYYGMVLKYWPTLSPEAFRLAVVDPGQIAVEFPLLSPSPERVRGQLRAEQTIIDNVYSQTKAQTVRQEREERRGGVAVTRASVTVEPRAASMPVNIRNVFDWLETSQSMPAIVARIAADVGRGRRDFVVEKTHVAAANPRISGLLAAFLRRPPRRPGVSLAIAREAKGARRAGHAAGMAPQFAYLTIYDDGRYLLESSWREDDRVGFGEVIQQLGAAAGPVIKAVNLMGAVALPLGGTFETPSEASKGVGSRTTIGSLTVSSFWPHALTTEGFREMKSRWRDYERAGIVGIRGLQQAGAYAFLFRKGITNYDPRAMERVVSRGPAAESRQVVTNHYAYLTDPNTALRWNYVYAGRQVRIYHRTTDLRIEVLGVDLDEFQRIRLYVFSFLDSLAHGPARLVKGIVEMGKSRPAEGRLRSLQERDPDLYDLKKFDEKATVYSVLCQGDRQPEIVTPEEARGLKQKEKSALVKYWNFTENRPAFYRCPTKRFPFLSFRAGEHPLGYCLPCCKKTRALPGSKAQAANNTCLQMGDAEAEEDSLALSRHVLSYGKAVPVGRVAHAPRLLTDGLLYDSLPKPYVYRLIGVVQRTPAIPDAGFFFSLAAALSLEPYEFVDDLRETVIELRDTYRSLAGGKAVVFATADDLADAIANAFETGDGQRFSPFGPGGVAEDSWKSLVADLVRIRYDVEVATFIDETGEGNVDLVVGPAAAARFRNRTDLLDTAILVTSPAGTYLLAAMDQKEFLRHLRGRGPARRFFSSAYLEGEVTDEVVNILRDMVAASGDADCAPQLFDLAFVEKICRTSDYRIVTRLINLRDMCYGVVLADDGGGLVYFPVPYTPYYLAPPDAKKSAPTATYGPRPPGSYPAAGLARFLGVVDRAGRRTSLEYGARLVQGDTIVGFMGAPVCGMTPVRGGRFFFHDPVPAGTGKLPWAKLPDAAIPYDMRLIDQAIYESGGRPETPALSPDKAALAEEGQYRHRLYQLFVAEFAALLQDERNVPMRQTLKDLIAKTRFGSSASLIAFRSELGAILRDFPTDADTIRSLVTTTFARVGLAGLPAALKDTFDSTAFDFDRTTLSRLRGLGAIEKVVPELDKIMRAQVELSGSAGPGGEENKSLMNMYVACSLPTDIDRPQCIRTRLKMPADRFRDYVSILSADILNPLKTSTLGTMTAGVIDGTRFIVRPGERIHIR